MDLGKVCAVVPCLIHGTRVFVKADMARLPLAALRAAAGDQLLPVGQSLDREAGVFVVAVINDRLACQLRKAVERADDVLLDINRTKLVRVGRGSDTTCS